MQTARKLVVACAAAGTLLLLVGCNSDQPEGTGPSTASINGDGEAEGSPKTPALPNPLTPGTAPAPIEPVSNQLHPKVLIETSLGNVTVELDAEKAPLTVDNFLSYVDNGFYDQTIFHQVFKDYVILGGSYSPDLKEKEAGAAIRNEARGGLKNLRGTIAMARRADVIDSATCQFFFNLKDNPKLDYKEGGGEVYSSPEDYGYCVFGSVTEGMDVLEQIGSVAVHDSGEFEMIPVQTVLIRSIRRVP